MNIVCLRKPPKVSEVFDTYWKFAAERQRVYFRRLNGSNLPWTDDPILLEYKFTNAYRASDRVSQYLIRNVIYGEETSFTDTVFRILLFKIFNKIETWELLKEVFGEPSVENFSVSDFDNTLTVATAAGAAIYSNAYIMPSGPLSIRKPRKHRMHLELVSSLIRDGFLQRLGEATTMAEAYQMILELPGIGPFLAYQYVTDLNYSKYIEFSEMEFVVAGPGAKDGISKCFSSIGDYSEEDVIRWLCDQQYSEFENRGLDFQSLWGRPLQLIDCQNLLCEVSKYSRVSHPKVPGKSGRTRIKQKYSFGGQLPSPMFPPKWNLNHRISLV